MTDTDKKKIFVEELAQAIENHVPVKEAVEIAKLAAGYSENTRASRIVASLKNEILEEADNQLKLLTFKAIKTLDNILDTPDTQGASNAIAASASILDRAGVVKKEAKEVNITAPHGIAFMPAKKDINLDDAEIVE